MLQYLGTWLVGHELRHASQLYGYFGSILGLVSFLFIAAEVTLIAAEINVVKARHLYPRSLTPPFTPADEAVLTALARQSQRFVAQSVEVEFAPEETESVTREIGDRARRDAVERSGLDCYAGRLDDVDRRRDRSRSDSIQTVARGRRTRAWPTFAARP